MSLARTPVARRHVLGEVEIQSYEWPGAGPTLFFSHATGFHAHCWAQTIALLPEFRCVAIDMRGHGLSSKPDAPDAYRWRNFGNDIAALAGPLGLEGAIGIGHSKGGHALITASPQAPGAFAGLLLVDPVVSERSTYQDVPAPRGEHFAARRRNNWASVEEMVERFASRPPFNTWDPAVLQDYCEFGLVPNPDGEGLVLACPPWVEAATYMGAGGEDPYAAIATIDYPVHILRAKPRTQPIEADMSASPTYPALVAEFTNAKDFPYPELTHFIPMQDPALVARHLRDLIAEVPG